MFKNTKYPLLKFSFIALFVAVLNIDCSAQFVRASGQNILDEEGNEMILRGIGLGGWMLQEGYMLRTWGAQHELESRIEELVGLEKKQEFYAAWLLNHCTKTDIDSMAAWGFNSVRLPMHFKLFTPPIEEEPIEGEITWIEEGFVMVDSLLSWVKDNDMYIILDLHAAPGGQGENADISDYDPSKPSLWESELNKEKMIALWVKLAERYANEPNIAAYDLINETNWGFDNNHQTDLNGCNQSTNAPLWDLQRRCIEAIRAVDPNHMIVIEGNCWGNNYNGLPIELWDDNITISYHKYWNSNDQGSLAPLLETRNKWNVPLWLGETGENSNEWFSDAIALLEANNIGWSWWPQKKMGGNNVQEIEINEGYQNILDYWGGNSEKPSSEDAYSALMQIAENLKAENNTYHYDVIDAMTRQPYDKSALPFKNHSINDGVTNRVYFSDYDFGGQGVGYFDREYTNETGQPGGSGWNLGGRYRNDGVDIEACEDTETNGFNVGWTNQFEWVQYTVDVESAGGYRVAIRHAGLKLGVAKILVNEDDMSGNISLEATGGYQNWNTTSIDDVILNEGQNEIKFYIVNGGANLNYLELTKTSNLEDLAFAAVSAITSESGNEIRLNVNKNIDPATISSDGFSMVIDGKEVNITGIVPAENSSKVLQVSFEEEILYDSEITISFDGDQIKSENGQNLATFSNLSVDLGLPIHYQIPGKIFATDFFDMRGLVVLKNEKDPGSDFHLGYTDIGDYAEYYVTVPDSGHYFIQARAANNYSTEGKIEFEQVALDGTVLNSVEVLLPPTGGWENWTTSPSVDWYLQSGRSILRMKVRKPGINLTWFTTSRFVLGADEKKNEFRIYPNPAQRIVHLIFPDNANGLVNFNIKSLEGKMIKNVEVEQLSNSMLSLDISNLKEGIYIVEIFNNNFSTQKKLVVNHR
jgi:aryl-phospho-beta-D-glucosidase BglC (GH1 family)